jgi:hypothetical protein
MLATAISFQFVDGLTALVWISSSQGPQQSLAASKTMKPEEDSADSPELSRRPGDTDYPLTSLIQAH